ncbi:MAG: DUF4445 domain-containing protein [Candidatus Aminicenantes bacterium]|nr:MAG: DUF4445 domain-containing protein [Candidatus Aminicenantes bacterium]
MKYRIKIISHNKTIIAKENELLADKIQEAGINISTYCNKRGLCGKCLVEIVDGELPSPNEKENVLLEQRKLSKNHRLACLYKTKEDFSINIPPGSLIQEINILTTGVQQQLSIEPAIKKYNLQFAKPDISAPDSWMELFRTHLQKKNLTFPLSLLDKLPDILEKSKYDITAVIHKENEILNVEQGDTTMHNFGIAIDIGTTTLVVELLDLNTGQTIDTSTAMNSQVKFGADVVSRISYAFLSQKNLEELRDSILKTLNKMIMHILKRKRIDSSYIYEIIAAGNTSMNHLLLGMPVKTLAVAPFNSVFTCLPEQSSQDVGFNINENGKVYVSPNIKSFVGGDVSSGLIASDLENKKGNYLFIDLGTNGELVLKKGNKFMATSTAAGPAFEGMNISCGMLALPGAIYRAEYNNNLKLTTIENEPASGICGTGLIDLLALFLERGLITPKGTILDKAKKIHVTGNIYITQKDLREMQLAIAAIKTGIRMILQENQVSLKQLNGIFIAGAFGNYLNIKNSMKIGLLPQINEKKVVFIGNSSLAGAKALLLSLRTRKKIESLVKKIQYISLASKPSFQDNFISALEFEN